MLKSFAVEYARRAKNVKLIAFHPGTTDTELSKPFQASVPKEHLFAPAFVVERLAVIMDEASSIITANRSTTKAGANRCSFGTDAWNGLDNSVSVVPGWKAINLTFFALRAYSTAKDFSMLLSAAALNSMLKSFAVEYARRAKNVKLIAFHPGTTDTELSKPFQASVPKEHLFAPAFVVERLAVIMDEAEIDGQLSFVDWDGKTIVW